MKKFSVFLVAVSLSLIIGGAWIIHLYNRLGNFEKKAQILNYKSLPKEHISALDFLDLTRSSLLEQGNQEMKKHKAIFVGIARDNTPQLPSVMSHIEYIGQHFADYRVIVFENDSSDATKLILNLWHLVNPLVRVESKDFWNKKRPSIKFLADIRNQYVKHLSDKEYGDFDIVIVLDMDTVYGVDIRGIKDSFSKIDRWDVVCSNGIMNYRGKMYDAFAFRNSEFPYSPRDYEAKFGANYWDEYVYEIQKSYDPKGDLMPVYSCFGGMAIYKKYLFDNCTYDSEHGDCEHVFLHQCMRSRHNARIFMNPAQILRDQGYHEKNIIRSLTKSFISVKKSAIKLYNLIILSFSKFREV